MADALAAAGNSRLLRAAQGSLLPSAAARIALSRRGRSLFADALSPLLLAIVARAAHVLAASHAANDSSSPSELARKLRAQWRANSSRS